MNSNSNSLNLIQPTKWKLLTFSVLAGMASLALLATHVWPAIFKGDGNLMLAARFWSLQFFVSVWAVMVVSQKNALVDLHLSRVGGVSLGILAVVASFASLSYWSGLWGAGLRDIFSQWIGRASYGPWFEPFLRPEMFWFLSATSLGLSLLWSKTRVWHLCLFSFVQGLGILLSLGLMLALAFLFNGQAFFAPNVRFLSYLGAIYGLWLVLGILFLRAVR